MKKDKDIHIRITAEELSLIEKIAVQDRIKKSQVVDRAIENYLKIKRVGDEKNKK